MTHTTEEFVRRELRIILRGDTYQNRFVCLPCLVSMALERLHPGWRKSEITRAVDRIYATPGGSMASRGAVVCAHCGKTMPWSQPASVDIVPLGGEESTMPKSRPPYPPEFRQRTIELVRKGRTPESLAAQFEPTAQTIRNWLAQVDRDAGQRSDGLTTDEREALRRLRRENKTLREERAILKKAAAWFATETGAIPSKDSSS